MTVKHPTASGFIFHRALTGWRLGLIVHPRLRRLMIPGGHIEPDETSAEAVCREIAEETGLTAVRLLPPPAPPLPAGFPHARVAPPWWITEQPVGPDNHLDVPHVHVDHQYVAVADANAPAPVGGMHPFGWYLAGELAEGLMFDDTRLLAGMLFASIDGLAGGIGTLPEPDPSDRPRTRRLPTTDGAGSP